MVVICGYFVFHNCKKMDPQKKKMSQKQCRLHVLISTPIRQRQLLSSSDGKEVTKKLANVILLI